MRNYDLVIFDCDGVLVDSERITAAVYAGYLGELGFEMSIDEVFERLVGKSMEQCLASIQARFGRLPPSGFVDEYRRRADLALRAQVRAVAGTRRSRRRACSPRPARAPPSPQWRRCRRCSRRLHRRPRP